MSSNWTGNPTSVDSPSPAPNMSGNYPIAQLPADGDAVAAASVAQEARLGPNWIAYALERFRDIHFGSGVDGSLSVTGTSTVDLTSMKYFSTVSVTAGNLYTNGWPIIARNSITVGNSSVGVITAISGTGGSASSGGVRGTCHAGIGLDGPHTHLGTPPTTSSATVNDSLVYGLGGQGGKGGGSSGASAANITPPGSSYKSYPYRFHAGTSNYQNSTPPLYQPSGLQYDSIRGGSAGAPGDAIAGVTGGGPGAGGCLVVLIAPVINLNFTSALDASGGAGGTGGTGNSNGGGGGGGGAFLLIGQQVNISGSTSFTAAAGTGGPGNGTGAAGLAGSAGNTTPYIVLVP